MQKSLLNNYYPYGTIPSLNVPGAKKMSRFFERSKAMFSECSYGTFQERSKGILRDPSAGTFREHFA